MGMVATASGAKADECDAFAARVADGLRLEVKRRDGLNVILQPPPGMVLVVADCRSPPGVAFAFESRFPRSSELDMAADALELLGADRAVARAIVRKCHQAALVEGIVEFAAGKPVISCADEKSASPPLYFVLRQFPPPDSPAR